MGTKKLPPFLKKYFWDVDFDKLNFERSVLHITERLLEFGDLQAIRWVLKTYGKNKIKEVIMTSINISPKTGNFWGDILDVSKSKVPSIKNGLLNSRSNIWDFQINN